jgi:hypothetical protein
MVTMVIVVVIAMAINVRLLVSAASQMSASSSAVPTTAHALLAGQDVACTIQSDR